MKMFKKFLAMFEKAPPPTPRGRVTPHDPDVIGNGAIKAVARPIPKVKYRVHRAATNSWEEFKEAQVKPDEGMN